MTKPHERSGDQKAIDAIFSGTPFGYFTSDEGLRLKYLRDINTNLDRHRVNVERSLANTSSRGGTKETVIVERQPQYMPPPEVIIDTRELAEAQNEVADRLSNVIDAQRDLANSASQHTPLFERMIRNQGVSQALQMDANQLMEESIDTQERGNNIGILSALLAYRQRNKQINQFSQLITGQGHIVKAIGGMHRTIYEGFEGMNRTVSEGFSNVGDTISAEAEMTRELMHELFADVGYQISTLTNEQVITRIAILQSLYQLRTTFLQTHEQHMLSLQQQTGLLERILQAVQMTEHEKESLYLWRKSERVRKTAKSQEDYEQALSMLNDAHQQDDINPLAYVSSGTIHGTLGHPEIASTAFAEADLLVENDPMLSSYILLNLGNHLMSMGRHEHAERVLRKATKLDVGNREVWFRYAKAAWMSGKRQNAIEVMQRLLKLNPSYYKAQIIVDSDLVELSNHLFRK